MKFEDIKSNALTAAKESDGKAVEILPEEMDMISGGAAMRPPMDSRFANATWSRSF